MIPRATSLAFGNLSEAEPMHKIVPCLWFDQQAVEAARFYASVFPKSKVGRKSYYDEESSKPSGMKPGTVLTVSMTLMGQDFMAMNGGPVFKFSEAVSFFVHCRTAREVDRIFKKLSHKGEIMMPLGSYPFSERYAFFKDRFGVAWQVMLSKDKPHITPCLLFVGKSLGKAEAAARYYAAVFKRSRIRTMSLYKKGEDGKPGTVKFSSFLIEGQEFAAMDGAGPHKFAFNESISFVVNCKTQAEVDYYWKKLTKGGKVVQCGWLKDRFGVSWQVVPTILDEMLMDKDPEKALRVMAAMLKMKKIDIAALKKAYEGK